MTRGPRILVLDDDSEFVDQLAAVLSTAGFEIVTTLDVKGAEDILLQQKTKIDAFIVDLVLPGELSGLDVISAVTRETPAFKIIAASRVFRDSTLEYVSTRLGADAFVEKTRPGEPFNAAEWVGAVRRVLGRQAIAAT